MVFSGAQPSQALAGQPHQADILFEGEDGCVRLHPTATGIKITVSCESHSQEGTEQRLISEKQVCSSFARE